ncbi:zinc finger protein [Phanerochaete sordida]|uniref:Zinc finger protein n=1 Tax=Phanerochaete sordida TaxID=48140 RepID=A0A9P3GQJ3_9APHY|nr:zinc finger protein [Phanerochaete sordida]
MSSLSYVDSPNDNLICCICRAPFLDPLKARTCCHTFCRQCILTALNISSQCPIDRCPLTVDDLSPADPLIRNLVDELLVYCPQRELGCADTLQRQLVEPHLRDACQFVEVRCLDETCGKVVIRKTSQHEEHVSSAEQGNASHGDVTEDANGRPTTAKQCQHVSNGCSWSGTSDELESHLRSCPYEGVKGFFDIFSTKLASLSSENTVLRRKVQALEGSVSVLRRENDDVKRALGPWYRPHGQDEAIYASTSRYTTEMVPPPSERPMTRSQQPRNPSGTTADTFDTVTTPSLTVPLPQSPSRTPSATVHPGSRSVSGDAPDLASYFPPEGVDELRLEERTQLVHDADVLFSLDGAPLAHPDAPGSSLARSPSTPYPYHDPHLHPTLSPYAAPPPSLPPPPTASGSPPHVPAVAPLALSTSLHRTLLSLRESIVTLSAAVDSLARRQDVALAAEAMRLNEEARSLRVVLHGVRMQMHSIMMDRNAQAVAASGARAPEAGPASASAPGGAFAAGVPWGGALPPLPFAPPRYAPYYAPAQGPTVSGPKL